MAEPAWTQLSLTGDHVDGYAPRNDVLSIDFTHRTNGQRVVDLARLGYLPEPVVDLTFGLGMMWTDYRPAALTRCDLDPDRGHDVTCDFTATPFDDDEFATSVFDPPYKLTGQRTENVDSGRSHSDVHERYGLGDSLNDLVPGLISDGLAEAMRIASRFVIVKCQDQIKTTGIRWQTGAVINQAVAAGWLFRDMLLLHNTIEQPRSGGDQRHARRNYSTFIVLETS